MTKKYMCADCHKPFGDSYRLDSHQADTSHRGQNVVYEDAEGNLFYDEKGKRPVPKK